MSLGAQAFKTALVTAAETVWASEGMLIGRGMPGWDAYDDIASFGQVTSSAIPATLSASKRTFEETLTCDLTLYCFRNGGQEQEAVVDARAFSLLESLAEYCRVTDTTLGGVVRWCFLTDYASSPATLQEVLSKGRGQVLVATFTAHYRITS